MPNLTREYVEERTSQLPHIPEEWDVGGKLGYKLQFKMCQLKSLLFDFTWGQEDGPVPRLASIVETPSKILVIDASLNEIQSLEHEGLAPLFNLKHLDVSLNRLETYKGVEVLRNLYSLNMSQNLIYTLEPGLFHCSRLTLLDLGHNRIDNISYMPALSNLMVLHLSNNKLRSLEGVQALSHLTELYVQHNQIRDILPLASSKRLAVLNAADNKINSLRSTVEVVKSLRRLSSINFTGNPIEKEASYNAELINNTTIAALDNVTTKPLPRPTQGITKENPNLVTIKNAARQAFYDAILAKRHQMEESVRFLQDRIRSIQQEYQEWEAGTERDMDATLRHIDALNSEELVRYDPGWHRDAAERSTPLHGQPWETLPYIPLRDNLPNNRYWQPKVAATEPQPAVPTDPRLDSPSRHPHRPKNDYSGIKSPDEILRHAYNELALEQTHRPSRQGAAL